MYCKPKNPAASIKNIPANTRNTNKDTLENKNFDFRQTSWGMSKTEVIQSEGTSPLVDKVNIDGFPYIGYTTNLVVGDTSQEVLIIYYFIQEKLFFARYNIITKHSNLNDYLTDFEMFKTILSPKYGIPEEETLWKDDLYKDDPQDWGMAIATGDLQKFATWETATTTIILQLKGDNYNLKIAIV